MLFAPVTCAKAAWLIVVPISELDLRDVLRDLFVGQARAASVSFSFLTSSRGDVDRRHGDIGDAEHDPLAAAGAGGLSGAVLGGAERRRDHG